VSIDEAIARYDLIADFYLDLTGPDAGDPAAVTLLELMGDVRGKRVLDIACGHGRVARELARRGGHVTGVDISARLLGLARQAETAGPLGITYLQHDIASGAALRGESFDAVACNHGLADIDDLQGALRTTARVLRPGGRFVFSILHPCFPGWDQDTPSSWPPPGGYYAEGWWLAAHPGIRGKAGSSHRMLSTYFNALIQHSLVIDRAAEPMPGPRSLARQRAAQPGAGPPPVLLVVRCRRP
jgi:2-polyprenyl-3-methyl-5-hydroxy-6-metoxy-1,4-benzoquinol methylase